MRNSMRAGCGVGKPGGGRTHLLLVGVETTHLLLWRLLLHLLLHLLLLLRWRAAPAPPAHWWGKLTQVPPILLEPGRRGD